MNLYTPDNRDLSGHINLLYTIIDNIGDELMLMATDGTILYVNASTVRKLGYSREALLKKKVGDFLKPRLSVQEWQRRYVQRLKRERRPLSFQVERRVKSGQIQVIGITAVYLKYGNDEFILSMARDMTRQHELQRKLHESKDLYRLLSEGAGDGIFTLDLKGRIIYANRALEKLVGVPLAQAQGRPFQSFVARESLKRARQCFTKAKKGCA